MENNTNSNKMTTLSQVMETLRKRGIHKEFRMNEKNEMKCDGSERNYQPLDLKIIKTYRFEGDSNPADNVILYVIEDYDRTIGFMIDSYGADSNYSGEEFDNFVREIPVTESEDYDI